jgi:hypothetical protein
MINLPAEDFNMVAAMTAFHISVDFHTRELQLNVHEYMFIAKMHGGRFGEEGISFMSYSSSPELAVHNVVDYYKLATRDQPLGEVSAYELETYRGVEKECRSILAADCEEVQAEDFGKWIDEVTGCSDRDPKQVAGRALEELTEGCLEIGLTFGEVMGHVADSWHNQCLKLSKDEGRTVWPSQAHESIIPSDVEATAELADTRLTLLDLQYLLKADEKQVQQLMHKKVQKLKQAHVEGRLRFSNGTFYLVKDHVK